VNDDESNNSRICGRSKKKSKLISGEGPIGEIP